MSDTSTNADKPHLTKPDEVSDSEVYRALMTVYLQRDTLSWSRTQALGIVEIGLLTASFALRGLIAAVTLVVGSVLVYFVWCLIQRDWQCRDHFYETALDSVHKPRAIILSPEPEKTWKRGRWIMPKVVWALLLTNVILAAVFAFGADSFLLTPSRDWRAIEIRTPGQSQLTYPIEPDKNITIEFDGTKVTFSAKKP